MEWLKAFIQSLDFSMSHANMMTGTMEFISVIPYNETESKSSSNLSNLGSQETEYITFFTKKEFEAFQEFLSFCKRKGYDFFELYGETETGRSSMVERSAVDRLAGGSSPPDQTKFTEKIHMEMIELNTERKPLPCLYKDQMADSVNGSTPLLQSGSEGSNPSSSIKLDGDNIDIEPSESVAAFIQRNRKNGAMVEHRDIKDTDSKIFKWIASAANQ